MFVCGVVVVVACNLGKILFNACLNIKSSDADLGFVSRISVCWHHFSELILSFSSTVWFLGYYLVSLSLSSQFIFLCQSSRLEGSNIVDLIYFESLALISTSRVQIRISYSNSSSILSWIFCSWRNFFMLNLCKAIPSNSVHVCKF